MRKSSSRFPLNIAGTILTIYYDLYLKNEQDKALLAKTKKTLYKLSVVFIITAFTGSILGTYLDNALGIKPFGTLLVLGIVYVVTWGIIWRYIKKNNLNSVNKEDVPSTK